MRAALLWPALLLVACASPALDVPPEEVLGYEDYVEEDPDLEIPRADPEGAPAGPRELARVAGVPLTSEDLAEEILRGSPDEAHHALDRLLRRRLLRLERERLGIPVPRSEEEVAREMERLRRTLEDASGGRVRFEDYLRALDLAPVRFEASVREAVEDRVSLGLVIRYGDLREGTLAVVAAACPDPSEARAIARKAAEGADLLTMAGERPARLPGFPPGPVLRGPPSAFPEDVLRALGDRAPRAVEVPEAAPSPHFVVSLLERQEGRDVAFAEVAPEIAAGLCERPLTNAEVLMWQVGARRRYGVRVSLP